MQTELTLKCVACGTGHQSQEDRYRVGESSFAEGPIEAM
jgi:hypothetical protein